MDYEEMRKGWVEITMSTQLLDYINEGDIVIDRMEDSYYLGLAWILKKPKNESKWYATSDLDLLSNTVLEVLYEINDLQRRKIEKAFLKNIEYGKRESK